VKFVIYGGVFVAGAIVGGLIVRRLALNKIEGAVGYGIDTILGKGSAYGGVAKTFVNMFVENN
jgi:hypothetical protein